MSKSNTNKWKDEEAKLTYQRLNSIKIFTPDTPIHNFQRKPFVQPWCQDLGNLGSPVNNLMFTPEMRVDPSLGYHVFDAYRFDADSAKFYNTNRPYSSFSYLLGSRLEQTASILHTQNVRPNWNVAVEYRKVNSPGFYKTQRNNHDNAILTSNYTSLDKHYRLMTAFAYNKEQHDENGGIINDSDLNNAAYGDRRTIATAYQNTSYSLTRSPVSNTDREFTFLLKHGYTWGNTDTTYNADSTEYSYQLTPRFSISHIAEIKSEKHTYKDLSPDSARYANLFTQSFPLGGSYYQQGEDSVLARQKWFKADNKILLNGFLGKEGHQLQFSAGAGISFDEFITTPVGNIIKDSLPNHYFTYSTDRSTYVNNYLTGELKKEALADGQWNYGANARFYTTGTYAGNFILDASMGKTLKKLGGGFNMGFQQMLGTAPYAYTNYENNYTNQTFDFNKESVTMVFATAESQKLHVWAGVRNYLMNNYIYLNAAEQPSQYATTFNLTQVWLRKVFRIGSFFLDNEVVYQQVPENAPVNVPIVMGKEQLTFERALFKNAIKIVTGVEARYNTAYHPAGYDAILNRFYYQDAKYVANTPELSVFLNFRIKRFRAFLMVDQVQQLFATNAILYTGIPVINYGGTGTTYTPVYSAPDVMLRFGFNWVMIN